MSTEPQKELSAEKERDSNSILRDKRASMLVSLLLALVVWVVFVVINGDETEATIHNVPVAFSLEGTMAEGLDLEPFWSSPASNPNELTIDVTIECKRYESISAEDLSAVIVVSEVNAAAEYDLEIRVSARNSRDKDRFQIVDASQKNITLFFDRYAEKTMELEPVLSGEVKIPEGYYDGGLRLTKKSVKISGPRRRVDQVVKVRALVDADDAVGEIGEFSFGGESITISPENEYGYSPSYITVEDDNLDISASIPIWLRTALRPSVDFTGVPDGYLQTPLRYSISPASVQAALPEESLNGDNSYCVGAISFSQLAPGHNKFTFKTADLKEVAFFGDLEAFVAEVDMSGMDTVKLTLPGSAVVLQGGDYDARITSTSVTVAGPAEVIEELSSQDLSGTVQVTDELEPGSHRLPMTVSVSDERCWAYGEYNVQLTINN